jgi:hypothetical protein
MRFDRTQDSHRAILLGSLNAGALGLLAAVELVAVPSRLAISAVHTSGLAKASASVGA